MNEIELVEFSKKDKAQYVMSKLPEFTECSIEELVDIFDCIFER